MIDGTDIELVSSTEFLGVYMYIDEHLTWEVHINIIANKIAKNLDVLRRIFSHQRYWLTYITH